MFKLTNRRRLRATSGNVAMIFALGGAALLVVAGSAIELTRVADMRSKLASAADAAALAAKKRQIDTFAATGLTPSQASGALAGRNMFDGNRAELDQLADNITATVSWDADGSARVVAHADAKLMLGGILSMGGALPFGSVPIEVVSVASSGTNQFVEIAMVLDNTGSMFSMDGRPTSRFTNLRSASVAFVNSAFDNMSVPDRLRIAVIPWGTTVNMRSETPLGWDPTPVAGGSAVVADRGTRTLPGSPMDRSGSINQNTATLNGMFAPVSWRGCVSGAGESQAANDSPKSGMRWDALAVPSHMHGTTWRPRITVSATCWSCPSSPPSPPGPPSPPSPSPPPPPPGGMIGSLDRAPTIEPARFAQMGTGRNGPGERMFLGFGGPQVRGVQSGCTPYACTQDQCDSGHPGVSGTTCWQAPRKGYGPDPSTDGRRNTFAPVNGSCINTGFNDCTPGSAPPTQPQPACVSDPNEFTWNSSGGATCANTPLSSWSSFEPTVGPNINCPMPMLGLSGSRTQVLASINRMTPVTGGTHADVGLRWGLRALSSRSQWASFFGIGGTNAPQDFGRNDTKKAMILITDGENTEAEDFPGFWGCSDSSAPGCSGAPDSATLDARMASWCQAIRDDYGVELYTVAVNITNPAAVARLAACAGDPSRAFAVDASQLSKTLEQVAQSIFQLHIKE